MKKVSTNVKKGTWARAGSALAYHKPKEMAMTEKAGKRKKSLPKNQAQIVAGE